MGFEIDAIMGCATLQGLPLIFIPIGLPDHGGIVKHYIDAWGLWSHVPDGVARLSEHPVIEFDVVSDVE